MCYFGSYCIIHVQYINVCVVDYPLSSYVCIKYGLYFEITLICIYIYTVCTCTCACIQIADSERAVMSFSEQVQENTGIHDTAKVTTVCVSVLRKKDFVYTE